MRSLILRLMDDFLFLILCLQCFLYFISSNFIRSFPHSSCDHLVLYWNFSYWYLLVIDLLAIVTLFKDLFYHCAFGFYFFYLAYPCLIYLKSRHFLKSWFYLIQCHLRISLNFMHCINHLNRWITVEFYRYFMV